MIVETAATFVATISALSTIIRTVKAAGQLTRDAATISDTIAKTLEPQNNSVQALVATQIDQDYIEIAAENIERARKRLKEALRDPSLPQGAKDQEVEVASYTICSELRRLKKLNGGNLPGDDRFHELWATHACDTP